MLYLSRLLTLKKYHIVYLHKNWQGQQTLVINKYDIFSISEVYHIQNFFLFSSWDDLKMFRCKKNLLMQTFLIYSKKCPICKRRRRKDFESDTKIEKWRPAKITTGLFPILTTSHFFQDFYFYAKSLRLWNNFIPYYLCIN